MGIDYGSSRIGLAVSDPTALLAGGAGVIQNNAGMFRYLAELVRREDIVGIVVGMPFRSDGSKGTKSAEIEEFIASLAAVVAVPVETWDESYTSVRAKEAFLQSGMKQKKRREKGRVDEMAARLLLQDYLDSRSR